MFVSRIVLKGIGFEYEHPLPLEYKGIRLERGYRVDILVGGLVVVEVKSVEALAPIHDAQLLTYLRLGGGRLGLLINFNVEVLKEWYPQKDPWLLKASLCATFVFSMSLW